MEAAKLTNKVWRSPAYFIAFGFGSGLLPVAPGTWGTLAAIPVYLLIASQPLGLYLAFVALAFLIGVFVCNQVSRDLGVHDYSGIVWDEVVGYLLTMTAIPSGISFMIAGFVLFRLFDILKPNPIRLVDKHIKGGLGIMLDDVLAALFAWCFLQGFVWMTR